MKKINLKIFPLILLFVLTSFTFGKSKEVLKFSIDYGFIHAGTASMTLTQLDDSTYKHSTLAKSAKFFDWFFKVRDTLDTFIDTRTLQPKTFTKVQNEGPYHKKYKADFFAESDSLYKVVSKDTVLTNENPIFDPLSAFFFVRNQKFAVGDTLNLNYVNNNKFYKMAVIIHSEEQIKVKAGKFDCYKIEPVSALPGAGLFKAEGKLLIWITRDEKKMPVKVEGKAIVGSISVQLTDFFGEEID